LSNSGTVTLSGGASIALTAGTLTLSGGGIFLMDDVLNGVLGNGTTLVNQQTIQGAGSLGSGGTFNLNNQGLVDAHGTTPLEIHTNFGTMLNTATLQASGGGTLRLFMIGSPGTLNNTGGHIKALPGSIVELRAGTISGGTLTTTGSGIIRAQGGNLTDL